MRIHLISGCPSGDMKLSCRIKWHYIESCIFSSLSRTEMLCLAVPCKHPVLINLLPNNIGICFFFYILRLILFVCVAVCGYVHVNVVPAEARKGTLSGPPGVGEQADMNCLV